MTLNEAFFQVRNTLLELYSDRESAAIAHELLDFITGKSKLQRLIEKENFLSSSQTELLNACTNRLALGEPLQYITGEQWFAGNLFKVNKHVLIPRPETEELVDWIVADNNTPQNLFILDIGTGSGCLAISLKTKMPFSTVSACDISNEALEIAQENAIKLNTQIYFSVLNFLDSQQTAQLGKFDVIVSNPPYIPESESELLDQNVRDFEPSLALFVPSEDSLLFYRVIAKFALTHLQSSGKIYFEVHQDFAEATVLMLQKMNFEVTLRKDIHQNNRMVKATKRLD
ncbi:MAG: peptide chain release factor N(5)-glutamine methyltransferase [Bacteroidetes bacterium]|nr:peptide chain release factor N(5)-glutamine methyltransferase [Bacteroidota bacterium]